MLPWCLLERGGGAIPYQIHMAKDGFPQNYPYKHCWSEHTPATGQLPFPPSLLGDLHNLPNHAKKDILHLLHLSCNWCFRWLGPFARVVQNCKVEKYLRAVGKRRWTSLCNVKDVFLSRAARDKEVEHTSGNNKILACIFNFLQTSKEVIQVRRSESTLSGSTCSYNNCEFSILIQNISLDGKVEKVDALLAARARLHRCKRSQFASVELIILI